ncbi:hypothetical protein ACIQ7D_22365 [Streptomyces sp. NPDC096310]|uniref:hypothetical protein n=1 Tax=Streptomyces sp. NPDC096310 TaxID=3366082 RepID=UPI003829C629
MIAVAVLAFLWFRNRRSGGSAPSAPVKQSARSVELGLLPLDQLDDHHTAPPVPELTGALKAARNGSWQPAADLLAATGTDWERRSSYADSLGEAAAKGDGWLVAWEKARPDDPDAAVVRARGTVNLAWRQRGAQWATQTSREQFDAFHETLGRSRQEIARAAELNPQDPTPYVTEIWTGLGLGYPHEEMHRLWTELTALAPNHYEAHFSALQYWCAKWRGSHELAREFAARAAAGAPPGRLMSAFPLIAWFEAQVREPVRASEYRSPEVTALVDAALIDVAAAPAGHPRLTELRHLLAHFLSEQGRYEAALEQFRLVDGYVGALPWRYYEDTRRAYMAAREKAVRKAG